MGGTPVSTLLTASTRDIDITHHALPEPGFILALDYLTYEFMPRDARKRIISLDQFEVSAANPSYPDADESLSGIGGFGHLA
jgi:hypothetical protein